MAVTFRATRNCWKPATACSHGTLVRSSSHCMWATTPRTWPRCRNAWTSSRTCTSNWERASANWDASPEPRAASSSAIRTVFSSAQMPPRTETNTRSSSSGTRFTRSTTAYSKPKTSTSITRRPRFRRRGAGASTGWGFRRASCARSTTTTPRGCLVYQPCERKTGTQETLAGLRGSDHPVLGRVGRVHRGARKGRLSSHPGLLRLGPDHDPVRVGGTALRRLETGIRPPLRAARFGRRPVGRGRSDHSVSGVANRTGLPGLSHCFALSGPHRDSLRHTAERAGFPPRLGGNCHRAARAAAAFLPAARFRIRFGVSVADRPDRGPVGVGPPGVRHEILQPDHARGEHLFLYDGHGHSAGPCRGPADGFLATHQLDVARPMVGGSPVSPELHRRADAGLCRALRKGHYRRPHDVAGTGPDHRVVPRHLPRRPPSGAGSGDGASLHRYLSHGGVETTRFTQSRSATLPIWPFGTAPHKVKSPPSI